MPDRDKFYDKYRLFYEPNTETEDGHPVAVVADYRTGYDMHGGELWLPMTEVEDFFFVLRPKTDHHARVALSAYAASCQETYPQLSNDLFDAFDGMGFGREQ